MIAKGRAGIFSPVEAASLQFEDHEVGEGLDGFRRIGREDVETVDRPFVEPELDVVRNLVRISDNDGTNANVPDDEVTISKAPGAHHVAPGETRDMCKQPLAFVVGLG